MTDATALVHQRCFHHLSREAAARCPACSRFFCRECVTEHRGKVICAGCLAKITESAAETRRFPWSRLWVWGRAAAGFLLLWFLFYFFGRILLAIPAEFHATLQM